MPSSTSACTSRLLELVVAAFTAVRSRISRHLGSRPTRLRGSASIGGGAGGLQPAAWRSRGRRRRSLGQVARHRQRHVCGSLRPHRLTGSNDDSATRSRGTSPVTTAQIVATECRCPACRLRAPNGVFRGATMPVLWGAYMRCVNAGRKLTPWHRLKIDPRGRVVGHAASSVGTLPRSRSLSR
jgi:hypothetical protein